MKIYKALPLKVYQKLMNIRPPPPDPIFTQSEPSHDKIAFSSLKPRHKKRAERLLKVIENISNIKYNSLGEIIYNDKPIEKSNIFSLTTFVTGSAAKRNYKPVGFAAFIQLLRDAKVPKNLISLKIRKLVLNKQQKSIKGKRSTWIKFQ